MCKNPVDVRLEIVDENKLCFIAEASKEDAEKKLTSFVFNLKMSCPVLKITLRSVRNCYRKSESTCIMKTKHTSDISHVNFMKTVFTHTLYN